MDIVLDSVSLNHLLRAPRRVRERFSEAVGTPIDPAIEKGHLRLALDASRGLTSEWAQTCGAEVVHVLITKWESAKGLFVVDQLGKLPTLQRKQLLDFGFTDTCDKLIVKIAIATEGRIIVSDDSDFWDPSTVENYGNKNAPVARLLREDLGITLLVLKSLMDHLSSLTGIATGTV